MNTRDYPAAYVRFLVEFHVTRDYFECHELLEEHWKEQQADPFAQLWVGLIQIAVGSYHHRRGNFTGALKMFRQSHKRLSAGNLNPIGLQQGQLIAAIEERINTVVASGPFTDLNLPISDPELLALCQAQSAGHSPLAWGMPSSLDSALVDRHTLRDRSDVILARKLAAEAKQQGRNSLHN